MWCLTDRTRETTFDQGKRCDNGNERVERVGRDLINKRDNLLT
jgi:hypothetical protein